MRLLAQAIRNASSTEPEKIRDALKSIKTTNVLGAPLVFDDYNQAGKVALIEGVEGRKVTLLKQISLSR